METTQLVHEAGVATRALLARDVLHKRLEELERQIEALVKERRHYKTVSEHAQREVQQLQSDLAETRARYEQSVALNRNLRKSLADLREIEPLAPIAEARSQFASQLGASHVEILKQVDSDLVYAGKQHYLHNAQALQEAIVAAANAARARTRLPTRPVSPVCESLIADDHETDRSDLSDTWNKIMNNKSMTENYMT